MRYRSLEHRFVDHFPDELDGGILYVSLAYGSIAHSCCCGCGEEIVTPLTPTDWRMTYDGETISLRPSVGNWTLRCRSHYVIDCGRVIEAPPWSEKEIETERRRDRRAKQLYYGQSSPQKLGGERSVSQKGRDASFEAPKGTWKMIVQIAYDKIRFWRSD